MRTRVKICGITNLKDAHLCVDEGVDALGFVFHPRSPRYISPEDARTIVASLGPFVTTVGVFVDEPTATVSEIVTKCSLTAVQLHGDESPEYCEGIDAAVIKAFRVGETFDAPLDEYRPHVIGFLLDTYVAGKPGGTGKTFNWNLARAASESGPIILAGGIRPDNAAGAIQTAQPYAVDVSSGVETQPGTKEPGKVRDLLREVRAVSSG